MCVCVKDRTREKERRKTEREKRECVRVLSKELSFPLSLSFCLHFLSSSLGNRRVCVKKRDRMFPRIRRVSFFSFLLLRPPLRNAGMSTEIISFSLLLLLFTHTHIR
jgi:hypothetical protein